MERIENLIIGGGPAGLALAYSFKERNIPFLIVEQSMEWGGNAKTFSWKQYKFDAGAHRFHDKIPEVTEKVKRILKEDLIKVDCPSAVFSEYQFFTFPLQPREVIAKIGWKNAVKVGLEQFSRKKDKSSFGGQVSSKYGEYLSERFITPYTEKLWGEKTENLLPEVSGNRLKGFGIGDYIKELITGKTQHIDGSFYYPKLGIGQLFDVMEQSIPASSKSLGCKVMGMELEENCVGRVKLNEDWVYVENVYNTAPSNLTYQWCFQKQASLDLKFRNLRLLAIELSIDTLTPYASLYFPERKYAFTRAVESKHRSRFLSPKESTILVFEFPCFETDELYHLSEESLYEMLLNQMPHFIPQQKILDYTVKNLVNAYPVLNHTTLEEVKEIDARLASIKNMTMLGRSGRFQYLHIHDLIKEGMEIAASK